MNRLINEDDVIARLETVYNLRGEVKSEALQAIDRCKTAHAISKDDLFSVLSAVRDLERRIDGLMRG